MSTPVETRTMLRSQKLYERLLALYPKAHRDEYGPPMAQLFRDQSRDAWQDARSWGILALWLRVLPDLVRTSFLEHLAAMKGKKSMTDKISEVTGPTNAPLRILLRVAVPVFLLVFGLSVAITFILPESFASTVRIKIERDVTDIQGLQQETRLNLGYFPYFIQTEFEVIQSEKILGKVIDLLDLNTVWGKKYNNGEPLKSTDTIGILKARMALRPVRNTSLVEITVYSEDRAEAAKIANTIGDTYKNYRTEERTRLTGGGIKTLTASYAEQESKVAKAQAEVDQLRKQLNLSAADTAGNSAAPAIDPEVVRHLQGELISFEAMLIKDETVHRKLEELSPELRRDALQTAVGPDETLSKLLAELNTAELTLVSLEKDYASTHPQYMKAKAAVDGALKRVTERVLGVMTGLANRIDGLKATTADLQRKLDEARVADIEKAERSRPYYEAKVRLDELERFRSVLSTKLGSEKLAAELPQTTLVEIIQHAIPGMRPVRPNKPLNLVLGAFGGGLLALLVGGGTALTVSLFRKRTRRQAVVS
jgi:uncharacterized protein involved in exopolysaccharide biosynthesis